MSQLESLAQDGRAAPAALQEASRWTSGWRSSARIWALAVVLSVVGVARAGAASAHASAESTSPAAGSQLDSSPALVSVTFDDRVEVSLGGLRLYDATGEQIPIGASEHFDGDERTVAASVPSLRDGGYVAAWRVVSADGHPVQGAFTFHVGATGSNASSDLIERLLSASGASTGVGISFAVLRWIGYLSIAIAIGGLAVLSLVLPRWRVPVRVNEMLWVAWAVAVLASVLSIGAQGASAIGGDISDIVRVSLWSDVVPTDYGRGIVVRLIGLAVVAVALITVARRNERWWYAPAVLGAVTVAIGMALGGHAFGGTQRGIGVTADALHVLAMAVWFGGLFTLACYLRSEVDATDDGDQEHPGVPSPLQRWSTVAFAAVVVLVASGVTGAGRQLDGLGSLFDTTYGRTLSVKVALVIVTLAIASRARGHVTQPGAGGGVLRRLVLTEIAILVVVFGATSLLVEAVPPRVQRGEPVTVSMIEADLTMTMLIDPARAGSNELHLYFASPAGTLEALDSAKVRMTLSERDLGPIEVPVDVAGPNHYSSYRFDIPYRGAWTFEITAVRGSTSIRYKTVVNVK